MCYDLIGYLQFLSYCFCGSCRFVETFCMYRKENISREVPYYEANYSSMLHPFQCAVH
jgi:hypothetical protein